MEKFYWTKEKCHDESLKYQTRGEFSIKCGSAYQKSYKNHWLDEICGHMIIKGNRIKRCIYAYEFTDNCVYIGLTYDIDIRQLKHKNNENSSVYKHILKTKLEPKVIKLTNYLNINDAVIEECNYVNKYKSNNWNIINKIKTGGIGGNVIKWTKEKCQEEALKYTSKHDLKKNNGSVYNSSRKNGWLDEICSHMKMRNVNNYWTKEKCQEISLKYLYRKDFQKNDKKSYYYSIKNGWLNEICSHMIYLHAVNNYWTKEKCQEEALKYTTKKEFKKLGKGSYTKSVNSGWLDEITLHMTNFKKKNNYWTKEKCQEEALKYTTKKDFINNSKGSYLKSCREKWLNEICLHMKKNN